MLHCFSQKYKQETYPTSLIRQLELGAKLKQKQKITSVSYLYCNLSFEKLTFMLTVIFAYHVTVPLVKVLELRGKYLGSAAVFPLNSILE